MHSCKHGGCKHSLAQQWCKQTQLSDSISEYQRWAFSETLCCDGRVIGLNT